jgi:hypothetical protein
MISEPATLIGLYAIGLVAFAASGLVELAMCAVELRRIDRDDWSRGEPWQQRHNHAHRERERLDARRAATLVVYSPLWPALVLVVAVRIITRLTKRTPARD